MAEPAGEKSGEKHAPTSAPAPAAKPTSAVQLSREFESQRRTFLSELKNHVAANRSNVAKLKELFKSVDAERKKRDEYTVLVKGLKERKLALFRELNTLQSQLGEQVGFLKDAQADLAIPYRSLMRQLEALEWKQQTEAVTPSLEKEYSKQIREVRKILGEAEKLAPVESNVRELRKQLHQKTDELRDLLHEMGKNAALSQKHHEAVVATQKTIDALKKQVSTGFAAVDELRKKLDAATGEESKINRELQQTREGQRTLAEKERREAFEKERREREKKMKAMRSKAEKILADFRAGKKISLDDMRVLTAAGLL